MVLISVDLPHPLGPRIQRCSPAPICNVTSSRAGRCSRVPRRTVTCSRERSGSAEAVIFDGSYSAHSSSEGIACKNRLKILELKEARNPRSGPLRCHQPSKARSVPFWNQNSSSRPGQIKGGENRFVLTSRGGWG